MELNVLLRGQSNAFYLTQSPDWPGLSAQIEQLLGFNGAQDSVNLLASWNDPNGKNTINAGTAFIGDWLTPVGGNWINGWTNNTLEQGLLNYINALPAVEKSAPTALVWLHNEYDSTNPALTTPEWMSAVQDEASQVRQALGQSASTTPYVFVNAIPYGSGSIDSINQAIKLGMEKFSADPLFHATVGVQADDVSMDFGQTGFFGGPHMDAADGNRLVHRLAVSVAETFSQYARAGSPVATGQVDGFGPEVTTALNVGSNQVLLTVANDRATLNPGLSGDAAAGVGWSITDGASTLHATAARVVDASHVLLSFASTVPTDGSAIVYYAYGYGRLAASDSDPGVGTAIYDTQQMPIWTPATGVSLWQGAGQGGYFEQNNTTGNVAQMQGFTSVDPAYQSEFVALAVDSVSVVATSPNAFLTTGDAIDALVATSGNNLLCAGQHNALLIGGSNGHDTFVADASGPAIWDVILNFHAGDILLLWGAQSAQASQFSWSDDAGSALLTVTGGGIHLGQVVFQGVTVQQATAFSHLSGSGGGMSYSGLVGT
jgi:hypothetical protein